MVSLALPAVNSPRNRSQRNFALALGISIAVHALLLSIHFAYPTALSQAKERVLDVVLVNSKHRNRPKDAQAKAQANLDAGGNTEDPHRATTPLPPSAQTTQGDDLVAAQQRVAQLEAQQREMLTQLKNETAVRTDLQHQEKLPPQELPNGMDLITRSMAMARMEAQIEKQVDDYNQRPRKKFLGTRTEEYLPAQYVEDWRAKVERIGNLNYPPEARGKLYGNLTIYIEINSEGELVRSEIQRSSGQKVLDDAALRILRLAAPFGRFPPELKRQYDVLAFARVWNFTQTDQLKSQ